jgi:hypothetical protein
MIEFRSLRFLIVLLLLIEMSGWRSIMGEREHKPLPCTLFDRGSNGAVVEFSGVVESDGVHSVMIVPDSCTTVALNLKVDPSMKSASWWRHFRSVLSSGHPGTIDKRVSALFQGVIVRSADSTRLDIELHRISGIKVVPTR